MMHSLLVAEAASESSNSNLNLLFYVVIGSMLIVFLFRAFIGYGHYKKSIYSHIYDNYLIDYYYKLNVFQDASRSQLIKKLLGNHRLAYANITNNDGQLVSQIITLIHPKGVLCISYLNGEGKLYGKETGDWYYRRIEDGQEHKYKIENPVAYFKEYNTHLSQVLEGKNIQSAIAVKDECDVTNVHTSFPIVKYSDLEKLIKEADSGYGLNDAEIDEIYEKLGGKVSRK